MTRLLALLAALVLGTGAAWGQEASGEWYPVDRLRGPAADPPDAVDLESPRATMQSFVSALDRDDYERAAAALRLPEEPPAEPAELARMLGEVIERQVWVDWAGLPARPDAALEPADAAKREPRRSVELAQLDLERWPVAIRLQRVKPEDGEPRWLFSAQTVESVPALYDRYGPGWMERLLPRWWRATAVWSLRRWEFAAVPALLVGSALAGAAAYGALGGLERVFPGGWIRYAFRRAKAPLGLLAAAVAAQLVLNRALTFSAPITSTLTPIFVATMIVAVMMALLRVIDAGLDMVTRRVVGDIDDSKSRDQRHFYTSIYALRRLVVLIAFALGVGLFFWELDIFGGLGLSLLASAGVLTVILGIAGQTVLGNILASLQIAFAKPIRIGDSVGYEGEWAYVESIFFTFVTLRTWDERRLIVPVQYFISNPFENWTMKNAQMTQTFWLTFDHLADTEAIRETFMKIACEDEDVLQDEMLKMLVLEHDAQGVRCRFYATSKDPSTAWNMHARLMEAVLAWVRRTHPEWWPREREINLGGDDAGERRGDRSAA
jgi:small-conductance mechanosensitive channel